MGGESSGGGIAVVASTWNPDQYARFRTERSQPFFDLIALVQAEPGMRVVDLGCGTGELTRVLHERLQARETVGIDSSGTMLGRAGAVAGDGLRFESGDIRAFAAEGEYDLVFSNAALQWVEEHPVLLPRLAGALRERGQIAVQMPANDDYPSHAIAHEVAAEPSFRAAMGGYTRRIPLLPPEEYASLLDRLGFAEQHVRVQVYPHRLGSREDIVEWVKGTLLTDYERRLSAELYAAFLDRYRERLFAAVPDERPLFYPFKRLLLWGRR